MHASNIGLAGARFVSGIALAGRGGVVGVGVTTFSRGGGACSADEPSVRERSVIAATRRRQPNVRIMAETARGGAWREGGYRKAYRSGDDGERVRVRFSGCAHRRDVQTSTTFPD